MSGKGFWYKKFSPPGGFSIATESILRIPLDNGERWTKSQLTAIRMSGSGFRRQLIDPPGVAPVAGEPSSLK